MICKETGSKLLEIDWRLKPYEYVLIVFALITVSLLQLTPLPLSLKLAQMFVMQLCMMLLTMYGFAFVITIGKGLFYGHKNGWGCFKQKVGWIEVLTPYFTLDFLMRSIRRGFALFATIYFFLHLKHVILWINHSSYDLFFWNLDRTLHFGIQPNTWMMEKLGQKHDIALFIDWVYVKYFDYKKLVSLLFLLDLGGRRLSEQFFAAYAALWAIGGLGYLVMPTDGPCYALLVHQAVKAPEHTIHWHAFKFPIVDQVDPNYVKNYTQAKIWKAKSYQETLWEHRRAFLMGEKLPGHFYGIAAMPSLHVAAVTMLAAFLFKLSSVAGIFGAIFGIVTFIGSIFLQWHYAIDGYIGFLIGLAIFLMSRKFIK